MLKTFRWLVWCMLGLVVSGTTQSFAAGVAAPYGAWAVTLPDGAAGWLRLTADEGGPTGELWCVGSPKGLTEVSVEGNKVSFRRRCRVGPPNYEGGPPTGDRIACLHSGTVDGDQMQLRMEMPLDSGRPVKCVAFSATRLPPMPPKPDLKTAEFGEPIKLFNGKNLAEWRLTNSSQLNGWKAIDGELVNTTPKLDFAPYSRYGNLRTQDEFTDFHLSIEFNVPEKGNSGIYLRGLYEAQVVDRDSRMQGIQGVGAIFGRIAPAENAGKPGGDWQRYDITLVDRHVTVVLNGKTVIDNQPIVGNTNGALFADVTKPGPIYLQGDHTAVKYRNIVLRPFIRSESHD